MNNRPSSLGPRTALAVVLLLLEVPIIAALAAGWVFAILANGVARFISRALELITTGHRQQRRVGPRLLDSVKGLVLLVALLVTGGLWLYSHLDPESFGSCHEVALSIGSDPSVRECEAYDPAEFAVPLGLIAIFALVLGGEGDLEITIPVFGTIKRTRAGKEAAKVLQEEESTLEQRGQDFMEAFLEVLKPAGTQASEPKDDR